ncbi:MAG: glycosyltransferase [Bacilli bacterium]|nr:glycosyltransferase [Bacilli bacterium]
MFLSVILPIYNVEKYLPDCLNSIVKQNFKDFEIILVDDGSKDSSPKICDDFSKKYSNVKVIHKTNGGLSSARNAGLSIAEGEYIYFLDSDDYLLNDDFFSRLKDASKNNPDIIVFKHIRFFENQNTMSNCPYDYNITENEFADVVMQLVKKDAFYGMAWIKAVKKEILINYNISFIEGLLGEDMPWNFDLYLNSHSIYLLNSIEYVYRQRDNSITTTTKLKNLTDFILVLETKYDELQHVDCNSTLKRALLGALAKYYSNLLITYVRVKEKDKKDYLGRIKKLSVLLQYALSSRPIQIRKVYRILGLRITLLLLKIKDGRKR